MVSLVSSFLVGYTSQGCFRNAVLVHYEDMSKASEPSMFYFQHQIATVCLFVQVLIGDLTSIVECIDLFHVTMVSTTRQNSELYIKDDLL